MGSTRAASRTHHRETSAQANLFEETADMLADRVIEKQWAYYTGAGASISFAAGFLIMFLYFVGGQPAHLYAMPIWFLVIGTILYIHYHAYMNKAPWRGYTQVALVAAIVLWPITMTVIFMLA